MKGSSEVAFEAIVGIHLTTGEFQLHSSADTPVPHRKILTCFRLVCTYKFDSMSYLHQFVEQIEGIES